METQIDNKTSDNTNTIKRNSTIFKDNSNIEDTINLLNKSESKKIF
jgi:hypothetical protein